MRKLILIPAILVLILAGCGPVSPQEQAARQAAMQGVFQGMQQMNQQKMYDAQYNYYTRPYKEGNITYIPARR